MRILALDCATTTGYAFTSEKDSPVSGIANFALRRGESPGMRFLNFSYFLTNAVLTAAPDLVVFEQSHHRGGAATEVCVGMTTRVLEICALYGFEHAPIHSRELKKWATGKGNASKEDMQMEAAKRFPHYDSSKDKGGDEADALLLLAYATERWSNEGSA